MDKLYEDTLLLDFYGQLLTERQFEIMDMHFNNDYSLGEIAEQLNISRQGVYDNIKRGKALLKRMEEKLGLVEKFVKQKNKAQEILINIKSLSKNGICEEDIITLKRIEEGIIQIIEG
ncbi:MAG TPA: YlxM family DNA-binding protein [Acetivibrio sp.]|nr:YlxM family DNA-binding protein [Acetivibrio sp.]